MPRDPLDSQQTPPLPTWDTRAMILLRDRKRQTVDDDAVLCGARLFSLVVKWCAAVTGMILFCIGLAKLGDWIAEAIR